MGAKLEELLLKLGNPGRLQVLSTCILVYCFMHSITMNYFISFITMTPEHHCKLPETWEWPENISIPVQIDSGGIERYDKCKVYVDPSNHSLGTGECPTGEYAFHHKDGERHSTITEWTLVCDRKYLVRILQTCFFVGIMLGGAACGFIADSYGRRKVWIAVVTGQAVAGIAITFVASFEASCVLFCIRGFFTQGQTTLSNTMVMEMFPLRYRTKAGIIALTMPALSLAYANFFAYFITEWRYQILVHSASSIIGIIGFWFMQENFRWMLSNQRIDEALKTAHTVAKFNGITLPKGLESDLVDIANEIEATMKMVKKQTVLDLLRNSFIRRTCLILCFNMFMAQICVYGFNFLINDIGGNVYVNFTIISFVDFIMRCTSYFTLEKLGRTLTSSATLLILGAMNLIFTVTKTYEGTYSSLAIVSLVVSLIGRIFNGVYFCATVMQSQEFFPTTVRSAASGVLISTGRFGLLFLPIILLLGDYVWKQFPFLIFGVGSIIGGLLALLLPETRGTVMPDTIEEVSQLNKKKKDKEKQLEPTLKMEGQAAESNPMLDDEDEERKVPIVEMVAA